ncbi:outer membrane protein transport protein, partial [Pseudomonas aeruginosa]
MPLLCALIVGGLFGTSQAQAGGFMVPTTNTAGWGRAMAGGSLFPNDPSAAFNNPAAMAFIDKRIAQLTVNYADIDIKYNGDAYDYQGNPMTGGYQDG